MPILKKLALAPIFLIFLAITLFKFNPFLILTTSVLSIDLSIGLDLVIVSGLVVLSSLSFIVFTTLANDWKFIAPIAVVAAILPIILIAAPLGYVLAIGLLVVLTLSFALLENTLKSYLTFQPSDLFGPSIKTLSSFLIILISITFYFASSAQIKQKGFQIPDSLIDSVIKLMPQPEESGQKTSQLPQISPEQLALLKQNPDLLRKSGLDPKILDSLNQNSPTTSQDLIKQTIKDQLNNLIKPYEGFIPAALALLLFVTLKSFESLLSILVNPLLGLIFYVLAKLRIITFTEEMRPIKKMVV